MEILNDMIFLYFLELSYMQLKHLIFLVLSIQKHIRKYKHIHIPFLLYLLTYPTITFVQITKIQNNSNTQIKHL
jgi:hypothetical protein